MYVQCDPNIRTVFSLICLLVQLYFGNKFKNHDVCCKYKHVRIEVYFAREVIVRKCMRAHLATGQHQWHITAQGDLLGKDFFPSLSLTEGGKKASFVLCVIYANDDFFPPRFSYQHWEEHSEEGEGKKCSLGGDRGREYFRSHRPIETGNNNVSIALLGNQTLETVAIAAKTRGEEFRWKM